VIHCVVETGSSGKVIVSLVRTRTAVRRRSKWINPRLRTRHRDQAMLWLQCTGRKTIYVIFSTVSLTPNSYTQGDGPFATMAPTMSFGVACRKSSNFCKWTAKRSKIVGGLRLWERLGGQAYQRLARKRLSDPALQGWVTFMGEIIKMIIITLVHTKQQEHKKLNFGRQSTAPTSCSVVPSTPYILWKLRFIR